jgi:hypothetical protein
VITWLLLLPSVKHRIMRLLISPCFHNSRSSHHAQAAQPVLRAKAAEFLAMLEKSKVDSSPQILKVYAKLVYK